MTTPRYATGPDPRPRVAEWLGAAADAVPVVGALLAGAGDWVGASRLSINLYGVRAMLVTPLSRMACAEGREGAAALAALGALDRLDGSVNAVGALHATCRAVAAVTGSDTAADAVSASEQQTVVHAAT